MSDSECAYDGCGRPVHARGVCSTHYHEVRARLDGDDVRMRVSPHASISERLAAHMVIDGEHLIWDGFLSKGAPALSVTEDGKRRILNVRILQLERSGSHAPTKRRFVRVTCGHDRCVHPDHLAWNNRRAGAVVSPEAADQMIQMHQDGALNLSNIADAIGVSRRAIYRAMEARGYDIHTRTLNNTTS